VAPWYPWRRPRPQEAGKVGDTLRERDKRGHACIRLERPHGAPGCCTRRSPSSALWRGGRRHRRRLRRRNLLGDDGEPRHDSGSASEGESQGDTRIAQPQRRRWSHPNIGLWTSEMNGDGSRTRALHAGARPAVARALVLHSRIRVVLHRPRHIPHRGTDQFNGRDRRARHQDRPPSATTAFSTARTSAHHGTVHLLTVDERPTPLQRRHGRPRIGRATIVIQKPGGPTLKLNQRRQRRRRAQWCRRH
jgi:hypothetical protein